jgi:O-antigen/teichoic acid export membrane protein
VTAHLHPQCGALNRSMEGEIACCDPAGLVILRLAAVTDVNSDHSVNRNIAANYVGRAATLAASYLFVPIYVSIIGIEAYGVIAFYTLLLTITALADIGLSATFSREAAHQTEGRSLAQLLIGTERILLFSVGACGLLIVVGADWIGQNWLNGTFQHDKEAVILSIRIMGLMLLPQVILTLYSAGLLGLQRQFEANAIQFFLVIVRGGLVIIPMLWHPGLILFFSWQLGATLLFAGIARRMLIRSMGLRSLAGLHFQWSALRPHWRYAGGMMAITVISIINTQFDKVLISRLFSLTEFAYYSLASTLAQLPIAAATPIAVAFFPRLVASVAGGNRADERDNLAKFCSLVTFAAALAGGGLALFSSEVLALWLQNPLLPPIVAQVTTTLAIGSIIICMNMPSYYLCLAQGQTKAIIIVSIATLLVSVPACLFAVQWLGMWGGALIWLLLNTIHFVVLGAITYRTTEGGLLGGHMRHMPISAATALIPLFAARLIADWFSASSLLAFLCAGLAAAAAILAFAAMQILPRRSQIRKT